MRAVCLEQSTGLSRSRGCPGCIVSEPADTRTQSGRPPGEFPRSEPLRCRESEAGLRGSFFSDDMGTKGPTIGAYTRVGTGSKVIGSITVGERAVIGAGAVVINDVPEAATVVGVPAKVVRQGPTAAELPAALERLERMRAMAAATDENSA